MSRDIVELVEPYLSDDPSRRGKLASDVQWRRLQLLLLREILVELRTMNCGSTVDGVRTEEAGKQVDK